MKKKSFLILLFSLTASLVILLTSCPNNEKYGADSDYFIGLKKLSENNTKDARQKFLNCVKKGSYFCAKESAKQLAGMGNLQEKNEAAAFLYENFPAPDTLLILAKQYWDSNEIRKLLEITDNLDFAQDANELIKIRLNALLKLNMDNEFHKEVYDWFTSRTLSQEQYQFFRDVYAPILMANIETESNYSFQNPSDMTQIEIEQYLSPKDFAILFRIFLYRRDYLSGYRLSELLLKYFDEGNLEPTAYLASDFGKSYLYGSEQIVQDAVFLRKKADSESIKGTPAEFYFWFYAGRLYDGANLYYKQAITCYQNAIDATDDGSKQDNALWYLLKTKLKLSLDGTIDEIGNYARTWHDPEYFDDFFDTLIPSLIVSGRWSSFESLLNDTEGYASREITAQIAYLYARLIEEGFIELAPEQQDNKAQIIQQSYEKALNSGTSMYYKILAAYRLNLRGNKLEQILGQVVEEDTQAEVISILESSQNPADNILSGYAYFGYPDKIYPEWQQLYKEGVSVETGLYIADFLSKCAASQKMDEYHVQALRIASRTANSSEQVFSKNQLKQVYPKIYSDLVDTYSKKYDINTSVIYALIRSESFFDKDIASSAGAVGLTQLMSPTAEEIAQKLRIKDYSLTDPETNIMFGTFYLSELIRRGNGSLLRAFFSYNAGFRRVSTWLNSSLLEFGDNGQLDMDLFLETIPVSETREYGRKLIAATVMYEYIYENSDFSQTVESLLQ